MITVYVFFIFLFTANVVADADCDELRVMEQFGKSISKVHIPTQSVQPVSWDIPLNRAFFLDVDSQLGLMFITDSKKIFVGNVDGTDAKELMSNSDSYLHDIAIDPFEKKLFVSAGDIIAIVDYSDTLPSEPVFIQVDFYFVRIELDTANKVMYLGDGDLVRVGYNGSDREYINIYMDFVFDYSVDQSDRKLYMLGMTDENSVIVSVELDGIGHQVLFNDTRRDFRSIESVGDFLYIIEVTTSPTSLKRISKTGGTLEDFGPAVFNRPMAIAAYCPPTPVMI